ncbi:hypothetical protein [Bradyrhizobium sp. 187]|uniref:hypothetical protein n=1 Tax=Bradyrhizobium sp. 187 TaxID=2782655 RepID=UPI00200056C9|nr:hypothetical protein [Bradyrhizobium sp. 187]UPJ73517.1 hypothetical protein IVB19_02725 [Bradyrhizobium sp. 187]
MNSDRQYAVASLLFDYVKSPSLRHLRDPHSVHKLAREIVNAIDRASSIWSKWEGERVELAKAAAPCWIPIEDLRGTLNNLPGPPLTKTDVEQRLRAIWEEPYTSYPNEDLKEGCLALYHSEKAQGTEMRAIIGMLQEHLEREDERLCREREERYRKLKEDERAKLQQCFLSGADCGWTPIGSATSFYCRRNGRTFRIVQGKDKRWSLFRVETIEDEGELLGLYQGRGDANKALKTIAYANERR